MNGHSPKPLRFSNLLLLAVALIPAGMRAAVPPSVEYDLTNISGWTPAQLATLPHFDRYVPADPVGASTDFDGVCATGLGLTAGNRGSLGASVEAGTQTNIPPWGTYYWSYWRWDGRDYHFYSGNVSQSPVRAANVLGQILGYATLPGSGDSSLDHETHGYLRSSASGDQFDITPLARRTDPRDLNDCGEITGRWSDSTTSHPFRRSSDGTFTDFVFNEPFSHFINPLVINNHGHVAGMVTVWTTPRDYIPFFSESGSTTAALPYPDQDKAYNASIAYINDHDVIVGHFYKADTPLETLAIRWTKSSGGASNGEDLNELLTDNMDFILDRALAVNDAGYIIASGHLDGGPDDTWNTHRFLLTPATFAPPAVTTLPAANVRSTSADLRAKINACNLSTSWHLEYGDTGNYGDTTATATATASGTTPVLAQTTLNGLQPNTTYHVRAHGSNTEGSTDGMDVVFTTAWDWPSWAAANLGGTDPQGDANSHGLPDLIDFATGNAPPPSIAMDAGQLKISFHHFLLADGVTLVVQVSNDLRNWENGSSYGFATSIPSNAFSTEVSRITDGSNVEEITISVGLSQAPSFVRLTAFIQ